MIKTAVLAILLALPSDTLTLREKVGMMFFIRPESLVDSLDAEQVRHAERNPSLGLTPGMIAAYGKYPAGGFCLFAHNLADAGQTRAFTAQLHSLPRRPLVCVDEEGGRVARLAGNPSFGIAKSPSAGEMARSGGDARSTYAGIGRYLREYGFDIDLAPVADVNTNPDNVIIGDRAFGSEPSRAAAMVAESVRGLSEAGVAGCLKHFPGHGDTRNDTHLGAASTDKDICGLVKCEMIPFRAGIRAGAEMVMVAHIGTPAVTGDGRPATLSYEIMEGLLRGRLGFRGVVITDAMEMAAVTDSYSPGGAAVASILAGADIILMPYGYREAFDAVVKAVQDGVIPLSRIERSVRRIRALRRNIT